MKLKNCIDERLMVILKNATKKEALLELMALLNETGEIPDTAELQEKIFYRETLMSTGIGLGIAIPHVRMEGIHRPIMAMGISKTGIRDYESLDDKVIWIIVLIVAGKNQHREYIQLLSKIISKLKSGKTIERLLKAKTPAEISSILLEDYDA